MAFATKIAPPMKEFEQAPGGSVLSILTEIIELGTQPRAPYNGKPRAPARMIRFGFEIDERMSDGRRFKVFQRYNQSWYQTSRIRQDIEGWRGRAFQDDEDFNVGVLLGKSCILTLQQDGEWTNIKNIAALMKGMQPLQPEGDLLAFDLDAPDWAVYEKLSEKLQNTIAESPEYRAARGLVNRPPVNMEPSEPREPATKSADLDDDIPF